MNTTYNSRQRGSFTNRSGISGRSAVLTRLLQVARVSACVAVISLIAPPSIAEAGAPPNGTYKFKGGRGVLISPIGRIPINAASLAGLVNVKSAKLKVRGNKVIVPVSAVTNLASGVGAQVKVTGAKVVRLRGSGNRWKGKAKTKVVAKIPASLGFGSGRVVAVIKTRVKVIGPKMVIQPKIKGKFVQGGTPLPFTVKAKIKMMK